MGYCVLHSVYKSFARRAWLRFVCSQIMLSCFAGILLCFHVFHLAQFTGERMAAVAMLLGFFGLAALPLTYLLHFCFEVSRKCESACHARLTCHAFCCELLSGGQLTPDLLSYYLIVICNRAKRFDSSISKQVLQDIDACTAAHATLQLCLIPSVAEHISPMQCQALRVSTSHETV